MSGNATHSGVGLWWERDIHICERNLDTYLSAGEGCKLNPILRWFLRATPSLLFLLFVCGYLAERFVSRTLTGKQDVLLDAMSAFDGLFVLAWMWSAGSFLNSVIHPISKFNLSIFRATLVITALYPFLASARFINYPSSVYSIRGPLHFLGWLCAFYVINQVSKALVLAETGNVTSFFDYAREFLLIWIFPVIGIWFIQPRINRLYAKSSNGLPAGNMPTQAVIDVPR